MTVTKPSVLKKDQGGKFSVIYLYCLEKHKLSVKKNVKGYTFSGLKRKTWLLREYVEHAEITTWNLNINLS